MWTRTIPRAHRWRRRFCRAKSFRGRWKLVPAGLQPVNQKVEAVLARNGLSAKDHTTTPLTAEDINDDTLLLVMEDSQREKIREDFPDAPHLQTIAGFLRLAGDIPALYGEPLTEYGKCYEALEFLIEGVLARLKEEEEQ